MVIVPKLQLLTLQDGSFLLLSIHSNTVLPTLNNNQNVDKYIIHENIFYYMRHYILIIINSKTVINIIR